MSVENADPRTVRTRARLHEAVLELAAQGPIRDVTVTELADRAGVHRSTCYEYAPSPAALLAAALIGELDEIRERDLVELPAGELRPVVRTSMADVMAHVGRHRDVYRHGLVTSAGLWHVLSDHFRGSVELIVDRIVVDPDPVVREVTARVVANGAVGAITAWLVADPPAPVDAVVDAYVRLLGDWPSRLLG